MALLNSWAAMPILLLTMFPFFFSYTTALQLESSDAPNLSNYDYGTRRDQNSKREPAYFIGVTGSSYNNSTLPIRKEIRELQEEGEGEAWTLYLLGLEMMQKADSEDPRGWYQIAGKFSISEFLI